MILKRLRDHRERAKLRREAEGEMRRSGRLPPGQRLTRKFPVLHLGRVPEFNPETWHLKIWGAVSQPAALDWATFQALPRSRLTLDLHCVTQWSKFDTVWEGVTLAALLEETGLTLDAEAAFLIQHAHGGYRTNLPLAVVQQENFLLATHFEGRPLAPEHGFPLRGVIGHIPGRSDLKDVYLWKGAKWLRGLQFLTKDQPGTWEQRGYHNDGDVWLAERWGVTIR